jgi:hypothetical protein
MKLALGLLSLAFLLHPLTSFSAKTGEMGILIERELGQGGDLGKDTLVLECRERTQKSCQITKTANGTVLSGKMSRTDADRIVKDFFELEKKRSSRASSSSHPVIYWGASLNGTMLRGKIGFPQDAFDLAVLATEQRMLQGLRQGLKP